MGRHRASVQAPESKLMRIKRNKNRREERKGREEKISCYVPVNKGKLKITFSIAYL